MCNNEMLFFNLLFSSRGNTGWDRHYACLTSSSLKIYAQPPNNTNISPVETFELHPANTHGSVILEPVLSEIGTPVATSDLPFIIKVDIIPNTTCWPPKSIILMTLSIQDKEKWFKGISVHFIDQKINIVYLSFYSPASSF